MTIPLCHDGPIARAMLAMRAGQQPYHFATDLRGLPARADVAAT